MFLASPASDYVQGHVLVVDGGRAGLTGATETRSVVPGLSSASLAEHGGTTAARAHVPNEVRTTRSRRVRRPLGRVGACTAHGAIGHFRPEPVS
jgi:hypothetical protein